MELRISLPKSVNLTEGTLLRYSGRRSKPAKKCDLHKTRENIVFGTGKTSADLMFVGEGPGAEEDKQGMPFVGRSGQLLTKKMIEAMGHTRDTVYIANIVKCRPPENRNPFEDESTTCIPYLYRQIEYVKPKVIVCLGSVAAQNLLKNQTRNNKKSAESLSNSMALR